MRAAGGAARRRARRRAAATAARAALLHDIGKAVSHEVEGPHALVGGELARRYKEAEAVAHAMESHHNEVEPQTVEAVIVQIVDAALRRAPGRARRVARAVREAAARPGGRSPPATTGVEKVYAMHAGREIRVIVQPEDVDDDAAALLSRKIARDVEKELEYPGQIKVTVIRESRSTDYARSEALSLAAMKRYHLTTFGCQMNEHDSERMKGMLESLGYARGARRATRPT